MTLPSILYAHQHVSEREIAHVWPNGQRDDSSWEDCTFVSGVEFARICHDARISASHFEAERLRQDAGKSPMGGSNVDDLIRGFAKRYGWTGVKKVQGFGNLWNELRPGYAAVAQGSMSVFPAGSRFRRWDPPFHGAHAVLVAKLEWTDSIWWCDPLAPEGLYQGERMSRFDFQRYVSALPGSHLVAPIKPRPTPVPLPKPPRVHVKAGSWWSYTVTGNKTIGYRIVDRSSLITTGFSANTPGPIVIQHWPLATSPERKLIELRTGVYSGKWVDCNDTRSVESLDFPA